MSWVISIVVALITAVVCGAGALFVSVQAMQWYRVSSFEGKSGYAAIALTFLGTIAAAILGLIAARIGVAVGWTSFGGQLLWALGLGVTALGLTALIARLLADVPPMIDGKKLDLLIELRFPPEVSTAPVDAEGKSNIQIGAMARFARVVRKRVTGTLSFDRARLVDGRWILPARVPVFTTRGKRLLMVEINGKFEGFLLPLPGRPKARNAAWSDWLPRYPVQSGPHHNELSYRFRVRPR